MHQISPRSAATAISKLRPLVEGRVIGPDDGDYDHLRQLFMGGFDPRPPVIVLAANAGDVARVVSFARDNDLELAVRGGGHSSVGHSTTDSGIVLDLREMKAVDIDEKARTVWADAGLTAAELTSAITARGLVVGFGDTGSVGISGITLGGGVGFLVRKYGLTIDSLLAVEMVTADGKFITTDADHHPDLFWAIRGGGGNFGVATRFQFRLEPLPEFTGGILILPATAETIAGFIAAAEAAPEELSTIANVMPAPPMPFLPAEVHGQPVILAFVAYAGDPKAAERAIAPLRALATPLADMVKPAPYTTMYPPEDPNYRPQAVARTMFIDSVDRAVAETILKYIAASDASLRAAQLRVLGGAASRVAADATAYGHRGSRIMVNIACFYDGPEDRSRREEWVLDFVAALRQRDAGAYVNFLADEGEAGVRAAYPGKTFERLRMVKARYDPTNLFRLNQNIPPAAS